MSPSFDWPLILGVTFVASVGVFVIGPLLVRLSEWLIGDD